MVHLLKISTMKKNILFLFFFVLSSSVFAQKSDSILFVIMSEDVLAISDMLEAKREDPSLDFLAFTRSLSERQEYLDIVISITSEPNGVFEFIDVNGDYFSISNLTAETIQIEKVGSDGVSTKAKIKKDELLLDNSFPVISFI